ncbi:hypothetical protein HQ865_12335 [Mucilaginibacter mali]|uniref:Uncharacterized protein n=1 Tax=Mucilaginibacter mali TaxID=2740462 RepID=A0A7D4Q854_9SPHI|nr:hypothetical protein [Mucilaginibacter mali]QKJ30511.1 hypothetical protein HQ865_12335 [Mucilaginibacter mali]
MDNQQALTGSADAQQHFLARQISIFLFDLKNEAAENGFKADESWTIQLATDAEMASLIRDHRPLVSLKLKPEALLNIYQKVKSKLQQPLSKEDITLSVTDLQNGEKKHLAAYPIRRVRK